MPKYIGFIIFALLIPAFYLYFEFSEAINKWLGLEEYAPGPLGMLAIIVTVVFLVWLIWYVLRGLGIIKPKSSRTEERDLRS